MVDSRGDDRRGAVPGWNSGRPLSTIAFFRAGQTCAGLPGLPHSFARGPIRKNHQMQNGEAHPRSANHLAMEPPPARTPRRRGPRYPFRANTPEVSKRISEALAGLEGMILQQVRRRLPKWACEADVLDAAQAVRITLWQRSLPAFDAWRGAKISTYCHTCIARAVSTAVVRLCRKRRPLERLKDVHTAPANDQDRRIEALAEAALQSPDIAQVLGEPGATDRDLARRSKVSARRISTLRYGARQRVKKLAEAELA